MTLRLAYSNPDIDTAVGRESWKITEPKHQVFGISDVEEKPLSGPSIEELYPETDAISIELSTATRLLLESSKRIKNAIEFLRVNDRIQADDSIQQFQSLLPELFSCRIIGDGYGMMINSFISIFDNLKGKMLTERQMLFLSDILLKLRQGPFISVNEAGDWIERIEEKDLQVTPPEFDHLADLLDEQSIR